MQHSLELDYVHRYKFPFAVSLEVCVGEGAGMEPVEWPLDPPL